MASSDHQGWLFSYTLTTNRLWLRFLRLVPLGSVKLSNVRSMRRANSSEYWDGGLLRFLAFWKTWHWPYPLSMLGSSTSVVFLLETVHGTRVFVRLAPGIHYRLRAGINEAKVREHGEAPNQRAFSSYKSS